MHQDPQVAIIGRNYAVWMLPGIILQMQFEVMRRYLYTLKIFNVTMAIQIATSILHFVWCDYFIYAKGLEVYGASIATNITYSLNFFITLLYVTIMKPIPAEAWHWFNWDSLRGWG